jgi:multisubunit Na+/H+ antiporter MnhC subunit
MITKVRDSLVITYALAAIGLVHGRLEPLRKRSDRGASAIEWAVIAAICVTAALVIGVAVRAVVTANAPKIQKGTDTG